MQSCTKGKGKKKRDRAKMKNWKFAVVELLPSRQASNSIHIFFCLSFSLPFSFSLSLSPSRCVFNYIHSTFFLLACLACRHRSACVWCHELPQRVYSVFFFFFFFFFFIDTIDDSLVVTTNGRYTQRILLNGVSPSTRDYSNDTQQCPRCVVHLILYIRIDKNAI